MQSSKLWHDALQLLSDKINQPAYELFIKRVVPLSSSEDILFVEVPKTLSLEYFSEYKDILESSLSAVAGKKFKIVASQGTSSAIFQETQFTHPLSSSDRKHGKPFLNPKYIFDNFVVGSSNRLCYAASLAVSEAPGKAYNPLFLYGGVGLGKTHLMQAIGHYIITSKPNLIVEYITTDAFINEITSYIQENRLTEFRNRYQSCDVLLIDDIQFIEGKERTQYEFFQLFNAYFETKKQIVITCDRLPKDIPTLEDRLISRLNWGLIADIKPPDFETRIAILRKKISSDGISIPSDVIELVATKITSNIRDLEGTLNRIIAYSNLTERLISSSLADEIIKDTTTIKDKAAISVDSIKSAVASYFGIEVDDLIGDRRKQEIVRPRMFAMYLARNTSGLSYTAIAKEFNKDHTTVMYSCDKLEKEINENAKTKVIIDQLISNLKKY